MRQAVTWVLAGVGGLIGILLLGHAFLTPINPDQATPDPHVDAACWACHIVTGSAETIELEEGS